MSKESELLYRVAQACKNVAKNRKKRFGVTRTFTTKGSPNCALGHVAVEAKLASRRVNPDATIYDLLDKAGVTISPTIRDQLGQVAEINDTRKGDPKTVKPALMKLADLFDIDAFVAAGE